MLRRHKWKLLSILVIAIAAIVLSLLYLRSKAMASSSLGSVSSSRTSFISLSAQLAASKGTSIPKVSVIPSKSESTPVRRLESIRRLVNDLVVFPRRLSSSSIANLPSTFPDISDYNLMGNPTYLVGDKSTEVVSTINLISCMSDQLRIKDVGLNSTFNPELLPYAAVVDITKCSADQQEIQTWYVQSEGPNDMGDGEYKSNMMFQGFDSEIHITLKNVITDGILQHSSFNFEAVDGSNGGILIIDNTVVNVTEVTFYHEMSQMSQTMSQSMRVRYNPITFVGSATVSSPDGNRYDLDFDYFAINRRTNNSGMISTACIDYAFDKKITVGDRYTLFNANDGSKVKLESGFSANVVLNLQGIQTTVQLWCSYWGFYASGSKVNGSYIDSSTIINQITNGMTVSRMDYSDQKTKIYTLQKQSARLNKVTRRSFTLNQVKGLNLKINNPGKFNGVNIKWNGTNLIQTGRSEVKCLLVNDYNQRPQPVETDFIPQGWSDCGCLDTDGKTEPYSKRNFGPYEGQNNNNPPFYQNGEIRTVLNGSNEIVFTFTSEDFSNGIQVSNAEGNLNGIINIVYTPLQVIHGMKLDVYNVGDTVTQIIDGSTNVTGEIYKETTNFIYGLNCKQVLFEGYVDSNNKLHVIQIITPNADIGNGMQFSFNGCPDNCNNQYWGNVGQLQSSNVYQLNGGSGQFASVDYPVIFTSSYCYQYTSYQDWSSLSSDHFCEGTVGYSSGIDIGALLTQGNNVARTTTSYYSGQQEGIGYEMISGTGFDLSGGDIVISSDGFGDWSNRGYHNIVGNLSFSSSGLDGSWSSTGPPVTFKLKDGGLTNGCQQFQLNNLPHTNGNITLYGWVNGLWAANINSVGDSCSIPTSDYDYDISNDLPSCDYIVTYKCKARIENKSSQVTVKLPSSAAPKFVPGKSVYVNGVKSSDNVYWIDDKAGAAFALEPSTILSYQTQALVSNDDNVPLLLCYDNCPMPTSSNATSTIATRSNPSVLSSNIQVSNAGKCSSDTPDDITFNGFISNPVINITWIVTQTNVYDANTGLTSLVDSYSIASVLLIDPGVGCDKTTVDVTINTVSCEQIPTLTLSCSSNGDYKDYRNAYQYHFDPESGLLIDNLTGFSIEISDTGTQQYFGNFFEGTAWNKAQLLCPWNKAQVCSWQSWQVLDVYYTYESGPNSQQITLSDSDNNFVKFQQPLNLVTQIDTTVSASGQSYEGTTVLLSYQGEGNMRGLPMVCLNSDFHPGQCDYDSTSYSDITLSPTQILVDLDGNSYYAKAAIMNEYYPLASDPSICSVLTFSNLPSQPDNSIFTHPENLAEPYPTQDVLSANYLNNGVPVVIAGTTTYELA